MEITAAVLEEYHRPLRFPFERLIEEFELDEVNEAMAASARGEVISRSCAMAD